MNTFLPYPNFRASARVLDDRRLHNQVNECKVILDSLMGRTRAWRWHPATRMWRRYERALSAYRDECILECRARGLATSAETRGLVGYEGPNWLGLEELHLAYRASLYAKDPEHYAQFRDAGEFHDYPYPAPDLEYLRAARRAKKCKTIAARTRHGQRAVDLFMPGTVEYWLDLDDQDAPGRIGEALDAWVLGDGTPVVKIEGVAGGYCMTRVVSLEIQAATGEGLDQVQAAEQPRSHGLDRDEITLDFNLSPVVLEDS